ncbi:hypothetical protein [Bacteroides uniformis]|uniref:hypothetical protein n=1 Tax=Bacteroides uniformis TaxID=820 RepID=UPI003219B92C
MIIKIDPNKDKDEQYLSQLTELKEQVEQRLLSLLRHLTLIDSTVLGILSVFHDTQSENIRIHYLLAAGSWLLFLSLLSGLYCMWQGYRTSRKSLLHLYQAYQEKKYPLLKQTPSPMLYGFFAKACLLLFCLGLLSLLAGLWL